MRVHGKEVKKNDIRCKRKSTILIIANNYSALHHLTGHLMRGRQSTRPFFYYNVFFEIFNPSNPTHYFLAVLSANSESTRRNTGVISSFDISLPSFARVHGALSVTNLLVISTIPIISCAASATSK